MHKTSDKQLDTIVGEQLAVRVLARVEQENQREQRDLLVLPGGARVLGNVDEILHELADQMILVVALLIVQLETQLFARVVVRCVRVQLERERHKTLVEFDSVVVRVEVEIRVKVDLVQQVLNRLFVEIATLEQRRPQFTQYEPVLFDEHRRLLVVAFQQQQTTLELLFC